MKQSVPTPKQPRITPLLLQVAALACTAASSGFWFLYFSVYWPYRHLFDEEGRYFDESRAVVHHAQSSWLMWPALAFLSAGIGLGSAWWARRNRGPHKAG